MDWSGAGIDGPLVIIRALHFAASAMTTGVLVFRALVLDAASGPATPARTIADAQTFRLGWFCLALTVVTGMIWLLLEGASMSGLSFAQAMTAEVFSTVLNQTQFGQVSEIRFVLAAILAGCMRYDRLPLARGIALAMALGLVAAIAWTGHAGSTAGDAGIVHLAADVLHLLAAAAWTGGLVSLVLLLQASRRDRTSASAAFAWQATRRFSTIGIAVVVAILATGIVNSWILVGSLNALIATGYGQLLILKMALLAVMLSLAAANRFWLTPGLALPSGETQRDALRRLKHNSAIELALALIIFAIVGILGTLHPAIHGFASSTAVQ